MASRQASSALTRSEISVARSLGVAFVFALAACSAARNGVVPSGTAYADRASYFGGRFVPLAAGNVYVANWYDSTISIYSADGVSKVRTITSGISYPNALAFEKTGSLYVGN